jgi:DNA invertase Pin-like site-specific DNA recombinase
MGTEKPAQTVTAGIYCRISQDRSGEQLGVDRQVKLCHKLIRERGWTTGPTFTDNDISAYRGRKRRPQFEAMLAAVKDGTIGAVVAYDPDRIYRGAKDLAPFIDVVEAAGAQVATVLAGTIDLTTANGRLVARLLADVAAHESEHKAERIRDQRWDAAQAGRPHPGGRRAFGYDRSGSKVVKAEAKLIKDAARRVVAGESLRAIATEWNEKGVTSSSGGKWTIQSLRTMLTGPRLIARRIHRGEDIGEAGWPPILTRAQHDELRIIFGNPRLHRKGRPPSSLLGGMIVCGACGFVMHASTRVEGTRRYICQKQPGRDACGRLAIQAERTEHLVVETVLAVLDTDRLARAAAKPRRRGVDDVGQLEEDLAALADDHGAGRITRAEWLRARDGIEKRLAKARASRDTEALDRVVDEYGAASGLRDAWPSLTTEKQRAILGAVIDRIVIAPAERRARWNADRVSIEWRA